MDWKVLLLLLLYLRQSQVRKMLPFFHHISDLKKRKKLLQASRLWYKFGVWEWLQNLFFYFIINNYNTKSGIEAERLNEKTKILTLSLSTSFQCRTSPVEISKQNVNMIKWIRKLKKVFLSFGYQDIETFVVEDQGIWNDRTFGLKFVSQNWTLTVQWKFGKFRTISVYFIKRK